ncbi:MAG: hypothetical protein GY722_14120 [bacterium]|nr:hypothetical protein [bacterium]
MKGKPAYKTQGQSTRQSKGKGGCNMKGGGTMKQGKSSQNRPCKPHFGATGQRNSGS